MRLREFAIIPPSFRKKLFSDIIKSIYVCDRPVYVAQADLFDAISATVPLKKISQKRPKNWFNYTLRLLLRRDRSRWVLRRGVSPSGRATPHLMHKTSHCGTMNRRWRSEVIWFAHQVLQLLCLPYFHCLTTVSCPAIREAVSMIFVLLNKYEITAIISNRLWGGCLKGGKFN